MAKLTQEDIAICKSKGFLRNRGTDSFSGRIVPRGCVFTAEQLEGVAEIAKQFGNGNIAFTSRLCAEIVGIPFEKIPQVEELAKKYGISFGGTGAKVRPITACKGTTCVYGNFDTQALATKLHDLFYIGCTDLKVPHKFKIAIGGCPNSCMKPSINDFGIQGCKVPQYDETLCKVCKTCSVEKRCPVKAATLGEKLVIDKEKCIDCGACTGACPFKAISHETIAKYKVFVGGTWGKNCRLGTQLPKLFTEQELVPLLENTIKWYIQNGEGKERLGAVIDRIGLSSLLTQLGI